jgi:hypothetical protein
MTIVFSGAQTVANIDESCARIRHGLTASEILDIDVTAVTEADLAFAQLILATGKSVAASGKALRWRVAADGPVVAVLANAGLAADKLLQDLTKEESR